MVRNRSIVVDFERYSITAVSKGRISNGNQVAEPNVKLWKKKTGLLF
ncbi:hypothetical protein [Flavobacterium sp. WV_118_3]